jgi:glucuronate isomerase
MVSTTFLHENFLLRTKTAACLYHDYAREMPIIDYHNHLPPQQIAENHSFENLSKIWLYGDHYKWRAMRINGVDESYCTGNKTDVEKFEKWAQTVPFTWRNPLFHWTALELKRYFNVDTLLNKESAHDIYAHCNELLQSPEFKVRALLTKMNVKAVCTTDDPLDSLEFHQSMKMEQNNSFKMLPAFRPDKFILIKNPNFASYVRQLSDLTAIPILKYEDLLAALSERADFFASLGCQLSDHGLEYICADLYTASEVDRIFGKALDGQAITQEESQLYMSSILFDLGCLYHKKGWIQQFHIGAMRNNNLRALKNLGPDTGWDSIGDWSQASSLSKFLARLDEEDRLSKTIIYNLNPADNAVMASMIGNFNDGSVAGKIQYGSGWWFLDQKDGMEQQMNTLSNMGLLSKFVGMLTDSRSFLSFPRHEYFRRILCNIFGNEIEHGELPADIPWAGKIIQDICYHNVREYLGWEK